MVCNEPQQSPPLPVFRYLVGDSCLSLWLIYHRESGLLGESKIKSILYFAEAHPESAQRPGLGLSQEASWTPDVPSRYSWQNVIVWNVSQALLSKDCSGDHSYQNGSLFKNSTAGSRPRPSESQSGGGVQIAVTQLFWMVQSLRTLAHGVLMPELSVPCSDSFYLIEHFSPEGLIFMEHPEIDG